MKYTYDYILKTLDKRFLEGLSVEEIVELQKSYKGIHNHNSIMYDFLYSDYYSKNSKRFELWKETSNPNRSLQDWHYNNRLRTSMYTTILECIKVDNSLEYLNSDRFYKIICSLLGYRMDFTLSKSIPYSKELPEIPIRVPSRYTLNKAQWLKTDQGRKDTEMMLESCYKFREMLDTNFDFEKAGELGHNWHGVTGLAYMCAEAGVGDVAVFITETLDRLTRKEVHRVHGDSGRTDSISDKSALKHVFSPALWRSDHRRNCTHVSWALYYAHRVSGDEDKAIETLKRLVNEGRESGISNTGTLNRLCEASVLLYDLEPTNENKKQAQDLILANCKLEMLDPYEMTRERLLVLYDYHRKILNKPI